MKRLHLLIPGLRPADGPPAPPTPGLAALLARSVREDVPPAGSLSGALARLFGIGLAQLPALCLAADGIDPGAAAWFRADPVHLRLGLDHVTLVDGRAFALGRDEADALVAALNDHFAGEIAFFAPHPLRWYARPARALAVDVQPTDRLAGAAVRPEAVTGTDAEELHRLGTEIQMLLHAQPANEAREARGEPPVNGLWLWGGGAFRSPAPRVGRVLADDPAALALARAAGIPHGPAPTAFTAAGPAEDVTLSVLDGLDAAASYGDRESWRKTMDNLDAAWFGPVLSALRRGRLGEVVLEVPGPHGFLRRLDRLAAWKLWRRTPANPP